MAGPAPIPGTLHKALRAARLPAIAVFAAELTLIVYTEAATGELRSATGYAGAIITATGVTAAAVCQVLTGGQHRP